MATEMENSPSSPREPLPKKPKMSTTSNSDDEGTKAAIITEVLGTADAPKKPRYKRRKVAIFFAYCGVGYQGMQKNPGAKTIEGDLEEALFHAGAVPEHDRGQPKRFEFARSARTDKGVSAVGQVISGRFYVDPPGFVERLQSHLPSQIRIFGYKRVTGSFHAKKFVDRRRYVYLLPVFALDPTCHRDRESVTASAGSGCELVKCGECSERGRKVVGLMGGKESRMGSCQDSPVTNVDDSGISSNNVPSLMETADIEAPVNVDDSGISSNGVALLIETADIDAPVNVDDSGLSSNGIASLMETADIEASRQEEQPNSAEQEKKSEFRYGEKEKERFNRILKYYEGTHNFHNFTTRTKAEDPSARRYILTFKADTTLTIDGIEFIRCEVVGQSFMLHQIRKMIGLAVAVVRNIAPESIYDTAFYQSVSINVPTAPEVGLYLEECFFTSYNKRWKSSHEVLSMESYVEEAEEFKMKYIYSHIAQAEHEDGVVALWLHSLNHRNYPDLRAEKKDGIETAKASDTEKSNEMEAEKEIDAETAKADDAAVTVKTEETETAKTGDAAETVKTEEAETVKATNDAETVDGNETKAAKTNTDNVKDDSTTASIVEG